MVSPSCFCYLLSNVKDRIRGPIEVEHMIRGGTSRYVGLVLSADSLSSQHLHGRRWVASSSSDDPFEKLLATLKNVDTKGKKKSKHTEIRHHPPANADTSQLTRQQVPTRKFETRAAPTVMLSHSTAAGLTTTEISASAKVDVGSSSGATTTGSKAPANPSTSDRIKKLLDEENDRLRLVHRPSPALAKSESALAKPEKPTVTSTTADTPLFPGGAAVLPLTTSEMIQEGAPQHFVRETETIERPLLASHGCVAMSDVVGRVTASPKLLDDASGNGVYAEIMLEYSIPFVSSPMTVLLEARAYGPELSNYASQVRANDVLHVSGHLLPLASGGMAVVALPQGGNLAVVLQAPNAC